MRTELSSSHAWTQTWGDVFWVGGSLCLPLPQEVCSAIAFPHACPVCPHAMLLASEHSFA